jgi:hypothetical protein
MSCVPQNQHEDALEKPPESLACPAQLISEEPNELCRVAAPVLVTDERETGAA